MAPSEDRLVQQLAQRYTAGAQGYAQHWQAMLGPMSVPLFDDLPLSKASRVLDVGCGPGTLTDALRRRASSARIVGIDNSPGMLAQLPSTPGAGWCRMDGRRLGFKPQAFDVAVLAFVLFHYPDITAGLREVARILRPGGAIGTSTFHTTPSFEAKRSWSTFLAEVTPKGTPSVADLSQVDHGEDTNRSDKVIALLEAVGFETVATRTEKHTYQWQPEEYIAVRSQFGSSGVAFRALTPELQSLLVKKLRRRFARMPPEAFRFTPTVLYTVASLPK